MIGVLFRAGAGALPEDQAAATAGRLVLAAMRRSVTRSQASSIGLAQLDAMRIVVAVAIPEAWGDVLRAWLDKGAGRKLILFGPVPSALRQTFGWTLETPSTTLADAARSAPAPSRKTAESAAQVRYLAPSEKLGGNAAWRRPFERFDFTDEWNNLGYGAIRSDDSPWAIAQPLQCGRDALAVVDVGAADFPWSSYAALADRERSSTLWINRHVGAIDSFEWRLVEHFLAHYRADDLTTQPVVREIPFGYDAMVTSRLDCDEDIESARALWHAYQRVQVPFSLAVHSKNLEDASQHDLLRELASSAGNPVLSHTSTHAANWGGTYDAARLEGLQSADAIRAVTGLPVRYAVSPFHQSPDYALQALADVGYAGCIGGIIRNDPAFVLARGGALHDMPEDFVGHSQQCMLHGDCLLDDGDPLRIYKQAFDLAYESSTLFGYLDHPFSPRYAYGWSDETVRMEMHLAFIDYIRARAERPVFVDENVAMDFLRNKALSRVVAHGAGYRCVLPDAEYRSEGGAPLALPLAVEWRGAIVLARDLESQTCV